MTILLVEDSAEDYEAIIRAFKTVGLNVPVDWRQSGNDALDFLKAPEETKPLLIILDLNMPGREGWETLQLIKEDAVLKRIPVVMLTTSGNAKDVQRCYQLGANSYIEKPFVFDELIRICSVLKDYWFGIVRIA